jgi:hypothetical protein
VVPDRQPAEERHQAERQSEEGLIRVLLRVEVASVDPDAVPETTLVAARVLDQPALEVDWIIGVLPVRASAAPSRPRQQSPRRRGGGTSPEGWTAGGSRDLSGAGGPR